MEPIKIIVENWPKTAPFLLEWAPTIIALVAVIVAICSMRVSIRDTIAFPKTASALSLMDDSPSVVSEEQLRELHIKLRD